MKHTLSVPHAVVLAATASRSPHLGQRHLAPRVRQAHGLTARSGAPRLGIGPIPARTVSPYGSDGAAPDHDHHGQPRPAVASDIAEDVAGEPFKFTVISTNPSRSMTCWSRRGGFAPGQSEHGERLSRVADHARKNRRCSYPQIRQIAVPKLVAKHPRPGFPWSPGRCAVRRRRADQPHVVLHGASSREKLNGARRSLAMLPGEDADRALDTRQADCPGAGTRPTSGARSPRPILALARVQGRAGRVLRRLGASTKATRRIDRAGDARRADAGISAGTCECRWERHRLRGGPAGTTLYNAMIHPLVPTASAARSGIRASPTTAKAGSTRRR